MSEKNRVAIVDAAFIHPTLNCAPAETKELVRILRDQGNRLVFVGNEGGYSGPDYKQSMGKLDIDLVESDSFVSGATLLASSARQMSSSYGTQVIDDGNNALSRELTAAGVAFRDLNDSSGDDDNKESPYRIYLGDLCRFTSDDIKSLLGKLDLESLDKVMAFCTGRISDSRTETQLLLNALLGTLPEYRKRKILPLSMIDSYHTIAREFCGFTRNSRDPQNLVGVTSDVEIYQALVKLRGNYATAQNPLFFVSSGGADATHSESNQVLHSDIVSDLGVVIDKLSAR